MSWKSCGNCVRNRTNRMVGEYLACGETHKYWCNHLSHEKAFWEPIHCRLCGGPLSEIREHKIKVGDEEVIRHYRHCYSCHMEFYKEEE